MLVSRVSGVRIEAIASTLPSGSRRGANGMMHFVADELQTTSDLGFDAAERIIKEKSLSRDQVGILLFGSRTPDYRSPNTAAILQGRLGLSVDCVCFDTNVGANGFIKMIQVAAATLANSNTDHALVVVGDTPSKLHNNDPETHFEISDAATAVLLTKSESAMLEFTSYSAGTYYKASYLRQGGFRDFDPAAPFDGSNTENFVVRSDKDHLSSFYENALPVIQSVQASVESLLVNSNILNNLELEDRFIEHRNVVADASELPLLLQNLIAEGIIDTDKIGFLTAGEGMALMAMTLNHKPQVLKTNHTTDFFPDYQVSHQM